MLVKERSSISRPFAVQRDRWPVFPAFLPDVPDRDRSSLLLLATVSRKCLPSALLDFLLRVNKILHSLSGIGGRRRQ